MTQSSNDEIERLLAEHGPSRPARFAALTPSTDLIRGLRERGGSFETIQGGCPRQKDELKIVSFLHPCRPLFPYRGGMPQEHATLRTFSRDSSPSSLAPAIQGSDHLLSKTELARYLGVTGRTVEEYQQRGLPYFRLSARRNRYDLTAVRAWLERHCRVVRIH